MLARGQLMILFAVMAVITSGGTAGEHSRRTVTQGEPQGGVHPTETIVASRKVRDMVVAITNADGRLSGGDNEFCVVFQKRETREAVDVLKVATNFALLVGKIQEEPIKAQLVREQPGRYCGHINLGKQYYVPASYYVFVNYTDAGGQKRKERLSLVVK